jgi:hypothetical protein
MRLLVRCEAQHPRRAGPSNVIGPYGGTGRRASLQFAKTEGEFRDARRAVFKVKVLKKYIGSI